MHIISGPKGSLLKDQIPIRCQAGGQHHTVDIPVGGPTGTPLIERIQPGVLNIISQGMKSLEGCQRGLQIVGIREMCRMLFDGSLDARIGLDADGEP